MFRALGLILVIWYLSTLFSKSFGAFDDAMTATFKTIESAAAVSQTNLHSESFRK